MRAKKLTNIDICKPQRPFRVFCRTQSSDVRRTATRILFWGIICLSGNITFAATSHVPDYSEVVAVVEAAYEARSELLRNSTGTADLVIKKWDGIPGAAETIMRDVSPRLGVSPTNIRLTGEGNVTTSYYQKGTRRRYDVYVPYSADYDGTQKPLITPRDMRIAVDPEKGIYYDVKKKRAYINLPPISAINPANLINNFRIGKLYEFNYTSVPSLLKKFEDKGVQPNISAERIGQVSCVKLEFTIEETARFILWFAPEQSYSLIKGQLYLTKHNEEQLAESYDATYQCPDVPGIWVLETVTILNKQGRIHEQLSAKFRDTRIGVELPDKVFTFEGLGVPKGTKLYDKRFSPEVQSYYGGPPAKELDKFVQKISAEQTSDEDAAGTMETESMVPGEDQTQSVDKTTSNEKKEATGQTVPLSNLPTKTGWWKTFVFLLIAGTAAIALWAIIRRRRRVTDKG